ncbi:MAG: nucleotide exchange factor GrpE [Mariprofundaceae bacterium]|nr:nucleotide exchange factor GrpE [Mariprofundaceae bacterium]
MIGKKKNRSEVTTEATNDATTEPTLQIMPEVDDNTPLNDAIALDENGDEVSASVESDPLEMAQAEVVGLNDKLLRLQAEMVNLRKRTQRDVADAHKFGVEKFATSLLDVVDNLERALEVEEGNEEAVREGVQLTLNSWTEMMKRFEVARIDAVGEIFDPHLHEALTQMPSEEPEGTVIAQHVAGYTLHGRLIRPAKVLVSSGAA